MSLSTWPEKVFATAPSTLEYIKQPTLSNLACSKNSIRFSNCSSVSPGKPTMKVLLMTISGQIFRHPTILSRLFSAFAGLFIDFKISGLAC